MMMNSPVTSTAASDDRNSTAVSFGFSSATFSSSTMVSLFATIFPSYRAPAAKRRYILGRARFQLCRSSPRKLWALAPEAHEPSVYQPQRAVPPRQLEDVRDRVRCVI